VSNTKVGAGWLLSGEDGMADREQAPVPPVLFRPLPFDAFSRAHEELHTSPNRRGDRAGEGARLRSPTLSPLGKEARVCGEEMREEMREEMKIVDERIESTVNSWMSGASCVESGLFVHCINEEDPPTSSSTRPDHDGGAVPESPGRKRKREGEFFGEEGGGAASHSEPGSSASAGVVVERAGLSSADAEGGASVTVAGEHAVASTQQVHEDRSVPGGAAGDKAAWVVDENSSPTDVCARSSPPPRQQGLRVGAAHRAKGPTRLLTVQSHQCDATRLVSAPELTNLYRTRTCHLQTSEPARLRQRQALSLLVSSADPSRLFTKPGTLLTRMMTNQNGP